MSFTPTQELELQALSRAAERKNQPRLLTFLGVVLILIAGFYAFSGYSATQSAFDKARGKADISAKLDPRIARYNALLQSGGEAGLEERFPVNTRIRSTLETSADLLGLELPTPPQRTERMGLDYPLQRQIITANLTDAPLDATLKWINSATRSIDGLYVAGVEFSPTPAGWQVEVRFARWEVVQ
ncbi:MAG: hypothetical protein H6813_04680 [Phycisphaeraceae bacterium]|nr:hypothetical protein [Phycisphaeraceae bacterium]MCB9847245.1 hypothetical protein [Phycisphaeraceae bacterium]